MRGVRPVARVGRAAAGARHGQLQLPLRASGRVWFLRLNEGKREADVAGEVALVDRLRAHGLPTPEIVRATDGRAIVPAAGRPATLFPWIDGREAQPNAKDPATVALVGAALGRLHRAGWGMTAAELPRNYYSLDELERRLESFADDLRVADIVPALRYELDRARRRRASSSGLIHQDLFPDNVLVDGAGALVAVLDFEQATYGLYIYDVAVAINAWCWTGSRIHKPAADAVLAAYEAVRPLDLSERSRLVDEARLAAARFAITRITDVFLPEGRRSRSAQAQGLPRVHPPPRVVAQSVGLIADLLIDGAGEAAAARAGRNRAWTAPRRSVTLPP